MKEFVHALKQARVSSAIAYMAQSHAISVVDIALDSVTIAYAVFSGAHIREWAYPVPSLRSVGEIDVLVVPQERTSH